MRECPGHHVVYGHGDTRTVHCPQCPAHDCRESGCGPGCSSSQGDRLDAADRRYVDVVSHYRENSREATVVGVLLSIIDKLAPRPGGSEG